MAKFYRTKAKPSLEICKKELHESSKHVPKIHVHRTMSMNRDKTTNLFFAKGIRESDIRIRSESELDIRLERTRTRVIIANQQPLSAQSHFIQYTRPLTAEHRFFFVEIVKLGANSNVVVGVAPPSLLSAENSEQQALLPGEERDTVGYHSLTGLLHYNGKCHGNMMGHKCRRGKSLFLLS